ncbi:mevalonate kinase [uncultured Neptuniibacter sp.]|uniref:mevalonate kinase n=1 Tax=uncultured Neptuniibacter sp. TaxID=502143 RepID=UPI00261345FC|nr:mevalonate kinase [uncultured Neptuniibacter sp.]
MQKISVKVPGSIMLMGEHAVLFGEKALACAVDKYITVSLIPEPDNQIHVHSVLAEYHSDLAQLTEEPRLTFVLAAIEHLKPDLPSGFTLKIEAEFSHTVGLGSSAAVTAGVVAALSVYSRLSVDRHSLFARSLEIVHKVQGGRGSGTDLVASIFGSFVSYRVAPREITALEGLPPISLFYVGYKTRTPDVLKIVEGLSQRNPEIYTQLYKLMGQVTQRAELAVLEQDWKKLGLLMNNYQGLMDALGVSDRNISELVYTLRESNLIDGVKISGSGLGDCVLALGADPDIKTDYQQIPVAIAPQGVTIEID